MKKAHIVSMLLVTLLWTTACSAEPRPSAASASNADAAPPQFETDSSIPQGKLQTLTEFDSIEIDVLAADIRVIPGEQWAVSYNLSEKEPLKRFGVEEGTLYVETTFNSKEYFDRNKDWFITVTIPEDAYLSEVELDTLSGNIAVRGFSCDSAALSSTSGTIDVEEVTAQEVELDSVSGKISATNLTSASLEAETVSSELNIGGAFSDLKTSTISGETAVSGSISTKGSLKSTSGNIGLCVNHAAALQASSIGPIMLNGDRVDNPLKLEEGIPVILKSVSGGISVQTNA